MRHLEFFRKPKSAQQEISPDTSQLLPVHESVHGTMNSHASSHFDLDAQYTSEVKLKDLRSLDESFNEHNEPSVLSISPLIYFDTHILNYIFKTDNCPAARCFIVFASISYCSCSLIFNLYRNLWS
jgi:hypothetical protein